MDPAEDRDRITRALGAPPLEMRPAAGHGAPSNRRWLVRTAAGRAFVKVAAYDYTADWLRLERRNYEGLQGLDCMPRLLGWDDDGEAPALAIEDLSEETWPPPWSDAAIRAVLEAIAEIHATAPPAAIDAAAAGEMFNLGQGWRPIAADPEGFLALGTCSRDWYATHAETLLAAADAAQVDGDVLTHGDVRSDNLCLREGRAIFVDWNWCCRGHQDLDLIAWLPSLSHEGGPPPWEMLPGRGAYASLVAGFFLHHARLELIPQAPHVRQLQLDQGRVALAWAARELGLPPPRG
jgi:hypothetical protein